MTGCTPDLSGWIGRTFEREDVVTERLVAEFNATLSPHLAPRAAAPLGIHWCLCPDMLAAEHLGGDGHPRLGLLLPGAGLPRRMWAGGEIAFHAPIAVGSRIVRTSTIEDAAFKTGKSGKLCFVTLRHLYRVDGALAIDDRQDIVYREPHTLAASAGAPAVPEPRRWRVTPSPVMLFRYSAMTFNGHRIHYDDPYARGVEGYGGVVVHGPLQATLMLNLAAALLGRAPKRFNYRGLRPLICGAPFTVDSRGGGAQALDTRVISADGTVTMTGRAEP